jgi:hemerythrin-like domain-containing protein
MSSRVAAALHEEHLATVAFLDRLLETIDKVGAHRPAATDGVLARSLREAASALGEELGRHFDFEEKPLFERLADDGEEEIVAQLLGEHAAIRPIAAKLSAIAAAVLESGFTDTSWIEYRTVAAGLCALLRAHIEIEERMLLPLLEESLDADADARLHAEYAGNL